MLKDVSGGCVYPKSYKFVHKKCGSPVEMITGCHQRFEVQCPECSKKWKKKVSSRVYDGVMSMKTPSFLTLTLTKHNTNIERMKSLWQLRKSLFKKLRAEGYKIGSWVAVVEYPNHLHICMDSQYIPQSQVSKVWKSITGDSYVVDIRRLKLGASPGRIVKYLSKYLGKSIGWPDRVIKEMKGFHVIQSHGIPKIERHKITCPCCGEAGGFIWITDDDFSQLEEYHSQISPTFEVVT